MPVQGVNVDIASSGALSGLSPDVASAVAQNRTDTQEKIDAGDHEAEARKKVELKAAQLRASVQQTTVNRQDLKHEGELNQRLQQIMGGTAGPEAAHTLSAWGNNRDLQAKLTDSQKKRFLEEMANSPRRATEAGNALDRLTKQPGFTKAVTTTQQAGTLQQGLLEHPKAEAPVADVLRSRFMQSPKADTTTKSQFLRFGLQQAAKNQLDSVKRAGDMLGTLAGTNMPRGAQRAAMAMAQRVPGDTHATTNLDSFAQHPAVRAMPSFARGKATELLAKTNGKPEVKQGFETLAGNGKFKMQTAANKGRFFATIGSGKPSEYRALTDKTLTALQSSEFPNRATQVSRFLTKMAVQVQKGGPDSVEPQALIKDAKKSPVPTPPILQSTEGLDEAEAASVKSRNHGMAMRYFNLVKRGYEQNAKTIKGAKYFEDVTLLSLRAPTKLDTKGLDPELASLCDSLFESTQEAYSSTAALQKQRMRETRNRRITPQVRRSREAKNRSVGRQPRYYQPNLGRASASQVFANLATGTDGAPPSTQRGRGMLRAGASMLGRGGSAAGAGAGTGLTGDFDEHVAAAVSQLGAGPLTAERATHMARAIAQQVAQQVVQQVTAQLLGGAPTALNSSPPPTPESSPSERKPTTQTDGWGIQRNFDRDLGGPQPGVTKQTLSSALPGEVAPVEEKYTGKTLLKHASSVRSLGDIMAGTSSWTELSKGEQVLLRNLGWNGQTWATRDAPSAKWPAEMFTAYMGLSPAKREAVRNLGYSASEWDDKVQALKMGQNA